MVNITVYIINLKEKNNTNGVILNSTLNIVKNNECVENYKGYRINIKKVPNYLN